MRLASTLRAGARARSRTQLANEIVKRFRQKQEAAVLQPPPPAADPAEQLDSVMASAFIKEHSNQFDSYQRKSAEVQRENERQKEEAAALQSTDQSALFPYKMDVAPEMFAVDRAAEEEEEAEVVEDLPKSSLERGFFVAGDQFGDEYKAGTPAVLMEEELSETPYTFHGREDAFEHIEMLAPGQASSDTVFVKPKKKKEKQLEREEDVEEEGGWKAAYGHEDPSFQPKHSASCTGCGAKFHCQDSALPGFVPVQLLERIVRRSARGRSNVISELCRRCFMLRNYKFLLNVNVCPVDYRSLMGHLKLLQEVLVLFVVDMTDIRGSIHRQLPQIIGDRKPMIVVGNKVDLLPPDSRVGFMRNFHDTLRDELEAAGFLERFNVLNICLASAKTGFGVEDLITSIYLRWMTPFGRLRGDLYVVGCTNAGKSTLFNTLIQSDLCKVRAMDLVDRVTTSIWPGTTLSLLKFPVMTPSPRRLELRRRRLLSHSAWVKKERYFQHKLFNETDDPKYLALSGHVESTFKREEDESQPLSTDRMEAAFAGAEEPERKSNRSKISLDEDVFRLGNWCFDTPGTVDQQEQLLDLFTLEELINVLPRSMIVSRTAVCQPQFSLLIGGIGRVDVLKARGGKEEQFVQNRAVYLTVFASDRLPLNVMPTDEVEEFVEKRAGTELLAAPLGDAERSKAEPFSIPTQNSMMLCGGADVLLSSIGWVMVSSQHDVLVRAHTPAGRGLGQRPPLLPFAVHMKGKRIPGTRLYRSKMFLPDARKQRD
ncbi:Nitric oxide-associated protein 1 [Aphelenchoides fujianensis]|nr:Nitric oxide-associated protein 1 [Aphelenchoides fujianensis]